MIRESQKLKKGQFVSHYEIILRLGAGGMGEVYLAEDKHLGRKVALKLLIEETENNQEFLRRFKQEARAASALNHPNIITIYQIGEWKNLNFIAMEFVEGNNLRSLIKDREMELNKILDITIQTASALSAAHAAGIVHRDIKPENIMVRPDGLVKVLDFGLAKQAATQPLKNDEIDSEAATREHISTIPGLVMGTVQYMSPEQARGKDVDARSDIWSLGVCLYEMITGAAPFNGETKSDTLAAILKTEPEPLSIYAPDITVELEHIIKKALGKDREERYQVVKDLLLDLKILQGELSNPIKSVNSSGSHATSGRSSGKIAQVTQIEEPQLTENISRKNHWIWVVATALILLAVFGFWYFPRRTAAPDTNFLSSLTSSQVTSWKSVLGETDAGQARFSPDGKLIAYVASKDGTSSIWIKQISGGEPFTRKQDDAAETSPLWSPDSERIAYYSERGGQRGIWVAPALGGTPTLLTPVEARSRLVYWSKDAGTIYFDMRQNLYAFDVVAKQVKQITNFDASQVTEHNFAFSPDGERIVYTDRKDGQKDLWAANKRGENPVRLTNDAAEDVEPIWYSDGQRIIYSSNRNGIKQICMAFVDGRDPVQLTFSDSDSIVSDVSPDGTKILYTTTKDDSDLWGVRVDGGKEFQLTSDIGAEFWQDVSPNGETIAYQAARTSSGRSKILHSLLLLQKTSGENRQIQIAEDGFAPRWSPGGNQLAFLSSDAGNNRLWVVSSTGGDARAVTETGVVFGGYSFLPFNRLQTQDFQWSADSRSLIYSANRNGVSNIWQTSIDGAGEKQLTSNEDKELLFFNPLFSPDGGRIAWLSMSTGNQKKMRWSVWMMADDKIEQIYQSEEMLGLVGWSASGRELIVKTIERAKSISPKPTEVRVFQIALDGGGGLKEIAKLNAAYFQNVLLSPDRKTLAFVSRIEDNDTIQILPSTGGAGKTLVSSNDTRVYFSSLAFAPDGKTLYYGKQANWQIISMINNLK
jgi:eukaryotic-like serine/threonine-protein kinase